MHPYTSVSTHATASPEGATADDSRHARSSASGESAASGDSRGRCKLDPGSIDINLPPVSKFDRENDNSAFNMEPDF